MTWTQDLAQADEQITVLLAAHVPHLNVWGPALADDPRLRVVSYATTPNDLRAKMGYHPDALVLEGTLFPGPQPLVEFLQSVSSDVYLVIPPDTPDEAQNALRSLRSVKRIFQGEIGNLADLVNTIHANAQARRQSQGMASVWATSANGGRPTGFKCVVVWNQAGGVGKTTIASNLAFEAARRGVPTLLIGLGAPDDLALITGLKPKPNLTHWMSNPTVDGLKQAIQKKDTLDVLVGFPDVLAEARMLNMRLDAPANVPNLVTTAVYMGYGLVVIDAPPTALAANAIAAATNLVLVARPSLEGVLRATEAYRTVVERLAGQSRLQPNAVHIVLNRVNDRLSAQEWHAAATELLGRAFPPVIAQIPDVPAVGKAQDQRRLPLLVSGEFARALMPLVDVLAPMDSEAPSTRGGKTFRFLGVKVKV